MLNKKLSKITAAEIETLKIKHPSIYSAVVTSKGIKPENLTKTINAIIHFIGLEGGFVEQTMRNELTIVIKGQFIKVVGISFRYVATKADYKLSKSIQAAGGHFIMVLDFQSFYHWYVREFECDE